MNKSDALYHGSPVKLDVLEPRKEHGDPDLDAAVFASPKKAFALAYLARWGDRDINQGAENGRHYMREMRPGAFADTYGGRKGWLYEVPADPFSPRNNRNPSYEVMSDKPVKPLRAKKIRDVLKALKKAGVDLHPYDPSAEGHKAAIRRMTNRVGAMSESDRVRYLKWVGETNPELRDAIEAGLEKKAAEMIHYVPKDAVGSVESEGLKPVGRFAGDALQELLSRYARFLARGVTDNEDELIKAIRRQRGSDKGEDNVYGFPGLVDIERHERLKQWLRNRVPYKIDVDKLKEDDMIVDSTDLDAPPIDYDKIPKIGPVLAGQPHPMVRVRGGVIPPEYLSKTSAEDTRAYKVRGEAVQGVGLRKRYHGILADKGVKGLAVNNPIEGTVELTAEGRKARIKSVLRELRRGIRGKTGQDVEFEPLDTLPEMVDVRYDDAHLERLNRLHNLLYRRSVKAHAGDDDLQPNPLDYFKDELRKKYLLKDVPGGMAGRVPPRAKAQLEGAEVPYKFMLPENLVRSEDEANALLGKTAALSREDVDDYVRTYYADAPDAAHGMPHINAVRAAAADLAAGSDVDPRAVDAAALLHDIGNKYSRDRHDKIGAKILRRDPTLRRAFDNKTRRDIIHAVRQHRASSGRPRTELARIVADADRLSSFTSPGSSLLRAYLYGKKHTPELGDDEQLLRAAEHQVEKYSPGGYGYEAMSNPKAQALVAERVKDVMEAHKAGDLEGLRKILNAAKQTERGMLETHVKALEKTSAPKWVKMWRAGKLGDELAAEAGKYSRSRTLKHLGSHGEGVSDVVSLPRSERLAVRKLYDGEGAWFSPEVFARKVDIQKKLGGLYMAELLDADPKKFITWSEYVKPSKDAEELHRIMLDNVGALRRNWKRKGFDVTDLHPGNIINGKVVDFLPQDLSGSKMGRLVERDALVTRILNARGVTNPLQLWLHPKAQRFLNILQKLKDKRNALKRQRYDRDVPGLYRSKLGS